MDAKKGALIKLKKFIDDASALPEALKPCVDEIVAKAEAPSFDFLPEALYPNTAHPKIPQPPVWHYGYVLTHEQMGDIIVKKIGTPKEGKPTQYSSWFINYLEEETEHELTWQVVWVGGQCPRFLSITDNYHYRQLDQAGLQAVGDYLKNYLDKDGPPVWCLDDQYCLWRGQKR